jgi:hypothetical protein
MRPLDVSEEPGLAAPAAPKPLGEGGQKLGEKAGSAFDRVVLRSGQRDFTVKDVLDAAWFRGQLQPAWRQLLDSLTRQKRAEELEVEADEETLQTISEEFRYERQLLTAEETERWLAARDLTEDDFSDYFLRWFWREHYKEPVTPEDVDYPEASLELRELLRAELLLSGEFDRLAQALGWRLAALSEADPKTQDSRLKTQDLGSDRSQFLQRTGLEETTLLAALQQIGRDPVWLEECLRLEAAYDRVCARWLTDDQRGRALAARRLGLTRVQVETIVLPSLEAAQEAVLCLREGEVSLPELAEECKVTCERTEWFIEDGPPDLQQALLSASPGEILAPLGREGCFAVCRLAAKSSPDLTQPDVRERLDQRLLEAHFAELKAVRSVLGAPSREGAGM